jgi:hypothetical protein
MYAASLGGPNSGWQTRGTWSVPGGGPTPSVTADSVTPGAGSGATETFALTYSDTSGATNLLTTWAWFNETFAPSAVSSCLLYYDRAANSLFLLNDSGSVWLPGTPGTASTLENRQCSVALADTSTTVAATQLTVNLALTFKPAFAGAKNIYMYAAGATLNSGWQTRGTWTAPGTGPEPRVTADSVTPGSGGGAAQVFAFQYSDSTGATNLMTTWAWFNATFASSAANSCLLYFDQAANTVFLINDAGTAWLSGTPGDGQTLQNSQCSIELASTTVEVDSTTMTVNVPLTFAPTFAGVKNVYMYATNPTLSSGWQPRGTWSVP